PFSCSILGPNYVWIDERNVLDHEAPGKKGEEPNPKPKCFSFEKMLRTDWRSLRDRDTAQLQASPGRHTHATDSECGAKASAQFLLNLCVRTLRLHIQVHGGQENCAQRNHCPQNDQ